jgi:hypothetical protein
MNPRPPTHTPHPPPRAPALSHLSLHPSSLPSSKTCNFKAGLGGWVGTRRQYPFPLHHAISRPFPAYLMIPSKRASLPAANSVAVSPNKCTGRARRQHKIGGNLCALVRLLQQRLGRPLVVARPAIHNVLFHALVVG